MKITFNLIGCGLENNGGSDTIIKSANTLVDLGHHVTIIDDRESEYTWGGYKCDFKVVKTKNDVPEADVIIATGFKTARKMLHLEDKCGVKFHWVRGWESWNYAEWYIKCIILEYPTIKLVNGIQLQKKLADCEIESHIVRPGYDFDVVKLLGVRGADNKIILGGLYSQGKKRRSKRTEWVLKAAELLKKDNPNIELWMYGLTDNPKLKVIDRYFKTPSDQPKNEIYNLCDIWLAPTALEGLHRPPAEAMLTECPVIGTNAELSGMDDYLVHAETGIVSENEFDSFLSDIKKLINYPDLRQALGEAARKKILSLGDRKANMTKMVEVLKGY